MCCINEDFLWYFLSTHPQPITNTQIVVSALAFIFFQLERIKLENITVCSIYCPNAIHITPVVQAFECKNDLISCNITTAYGIVF